MWAPASRPATSATAGKRRSESGFQAHPLSPRATSSFLLLDALVPFAAKSRERFPDLDLETAWHGPIVAAVGQLVGQISLALHERVGRVVCVLVALSVAQPLHEFRGRVSEAQRNVECSELLDVGLRFTI